MRWHHPRFAWRERCDARRCARNRHRIAHCLSRTHVPQGIHMWLFVAASVQAGVEQPTVASCQAQGYAFDALVAAKLERTMPPKSWQKHFGYMGSVIKRRVVDKNVPGAVVELGVLSGGTSRTLRRFIDAFSPGRPFHVYDSFEGLPARVQADGVQQRAVDGKGGMAVSEENFKKGFFAHNLTLPEGIHRGYFGNIPAREYPKPIAFAFFDGDLYTSIMQSFQKVYHKMSPGGVIMVHDYTESGLFPGAKKAIDEFLADKPERVHECFGILALVVKQ